MNLLQSALRETLPREADRLDELSPLWVRLYEVRRSVCRCTVGSGGKSKDFTGQDK